MDNKTKNGNAWRRTQSLVCVLLIVLMFAASFIPLYSIDVDIPQKMQSAVYEIEEVINDPLISDGESISIDFPDKLNVNLVLFFKAGTKIKDVTRLYSGMMRLSEVRNASSVNDYHQAYSNLRKIANDTKHIVSDKDFSNIVALGATVVSAYSQGTLMGIIMIIMLVMTVVLPISLFLALLITLIGLLIYVKRPEKRYLWIMKSFRRASRAYLIVLAVLLFDSSVNLSVGILIGLAACIFGFAFSAFSCRKKEYSPVGRTYLNVIQSAAAIQTALYFGLFFCIAKSEIIGQYTALIGKRAIPYIRSKEYGEEFLTQFRFVFLAFIGVVALVVTLSLLPALLSKLGGMSNSNKDSNIFATICTTVLLIVMSLAAVTEKTITVSDKGIIFTVLAFLCSTMLILCEVTVKLLRQSLCQGLKETEKYAILRGLDVVETERFDEND